MFNPENNRKENQLENIQADIKEYSIESKINPNDILSFYLKLNQKEEDGTSLYLVDDYDTTQEFSDVMKNDLGMEPFIKEKTVDVNLEVSASQIENFVKDNFSEDFLQKCLVGQIILDTDTTVIAVMKENKLGLDINGRYFVPNQKVQNWLDSFNEEQQKSLKEMCFRAYSMPNWRNKDKDQVYKKYFYSPIIIYSQKFSTDHINNIDYLIDIPMSEKKEKYVLGHISHEIGHHIYNNLMVDHDLEYQWKSIIDKNGNLTKYATDYEDIKEKKEYDENLAEAIRLYTITPKYLKKNFLEVFNFINKNFPQIKNNDFEN